MNMIKIKTHSERKQHKLWLLLVLPALFLSCHKMKVEPVEVYPEPPSALVKFLDGNPNPAIGAEGSEVVFKVEGLNGKIGQFEFFINQIKAEVLSVTENTVTVKVPVNASTGGSSILINEEYYFGPTFRVRGKVSIDPTFNTDTYRSNGPIFEMTSWDDSHYLISGRFTDYQKQATQTVKVPGMALITKTDLGFKGAGAITSQFNVGKDGIGGGIITTVIPVEDNKYLIAGAFNKYDTISNINNITRINSNGTVDSMKVEVVGIPPLDKAVVPSFNGGVLGNAGNVFYNDDTKEVTLIGNFFGHVSTFYERSSVDGPFLDFVTAKSLLRMKGDGSYDSSFNYNRATNESYAGPNGSIYDAVQLDNGNIIAAGNFTSFHGLTANYIVRINGTDGSVDQTFTASADGPINRIIQNEVTGNIMVSGNFKNFNGQPANGVVMINSDGMLNAGFKFAEIDGVANFAGQLDNGKIIVSGTFNKYGDIVRVGMAILNLDGTLAVGYNNTGLFRGQINNFVETISSTGVPAVILFGSFDRFDNKEVGNIVKFRMEN